MKFLKNAAVSSVFVAACAWLLPVVAPAPAAAQEDAAAPPVELEEIVVIGSRRDPRTVLESAVPVDVLGADDLRNQGSTDMDDMLRTLHPSYNISRHGIDDEATLVRPATLRGLPPDSAMVLLNGKRRHRSGVIALLGSSLNSGSQGPDLSVIPSIALRQVELLRDGASAQYGADAIAGVLNFQLREDSEGMDLEARIGQYLHESDGELIHLAGNFGFELTSDGFFNLSLEYREAADTVRSGTRGDARTLTQRGYPLKDPAQIWGSPDTRDALTLFFNSGLELTPDVNAYAFGGWHQRESEGGFFLRAPGTGSARGAVFQSGGERLVAPRLHLGEDGEPVTDASDNPLNAAGDMLPTQMDCQDNLPALDSNFAAVQNYISSNPDCFLFNEMFPGGFTPRFGADISDWSIVLGLKGGVNDLRWDFSVGAARSEVDFFLNNSINASLGPDTPTSFDPRTYIQEEMSANLDFVQPLEVGFFASPLNIAFGLEWREESFTSEAGDEASYIDGPYDRYGFSIGSNGYQGLLPKASGEWDRPNLAAYIDLEADVTERLLVGVAARYEDFYDDFGDTIKGKLALSYELTPGLRLRGTVSSGFRAPSPGQANLSVLSTSFTETGGGDLLVESGQLPPTDPIAAALGGEPLKEEESVNYSAGLAWRVSDRMTLTFDYFRIEVEDRVSLTGEISLDDLMLRNCNHGDADSAIVEVCDASTAHTVDPVVTASSVAEDTFGGATVRRVRFYANDFDTTTQGLDLVLTWSPIWSVDTDIELAWNWTETEVDSSSVNTINCFPRENGGCDPLVTETAEGSGVYENTSQPVALLTPRRQNELEDLNPEHRIVLTSRHRLGDLSGMLRLSRYSSWKACRFQSTGCPDYDSYSGAWVFDLEVGYDIDERTSVAFGIQNLFDEFPDAHPEETGGQGNLHPASTPWDYNGTFGYVRFSSKF